MFQRILKTVLKKAWAQFPVVVLTGARQVGKTTLARDFLPDANYVTLDVFAEAESARQSPVRFLDEHPAPLIIDEAQYAPSLFRELKIRVDNDRRAMGRYLVTGSQSFEVMAGVTESLAGRCATLSLPALSLAELPKTTPVESFLWRGGFPELWQNPGLDRDLWLGSYVTTYLERDVRSLRNVGNLRDFERLLRALALRAGQLLSFSDLARDVGVSPNTAKSWISILEANRQIFLLEPWHRQRVKRLVKSPKVYFYDTGLLTFLMAFGSGQEVMTHALWDAVWENLVIAEIRKFFQIHGRRPPLWFWRTATGNEIDLLVETAPEVFLAIECKTAEQPGADATRQFYALRDEYGARSLQRAFVACRTSTAYPFATDGFCTEAVRPDGPDGLLRRLEILVHESDGGK
jgi:predicted AAA+ superfamily ATPase